MRADWAPPNDLTFSLTGLPLAQYEERRGLAASNRHMSLIATQPAEIELARWDGDLRSRRVRVRDAQLVFEMFGTPSPLKRLHVFLSAGGGALKDGVVPQFPRASWHPWLEGVCLNIDDPTFYAFPGELQTGWYLGTPEQDAISSVAAVIEKVRLRYGIETDETYIIGSSAGGTSALKVAGAVAGSTAIVENPPIYPHESSSSKYLQRVGLDVRKRSYRRRNDLNHIFEHPTSRFFLLQNAADTEFADQLIRLLKTRGLSEPRIGLNETGPLSVYMTSVPTLSPHHVFLSVHEFRALLGVVTGKTQGVAGDAVLDAVHEGLRARALAADQMSNLQGWAKLFTRMDIPELADHPVPTHADVARLALRSNRGVTYRLRMGHKAKYVFIALDVKPGQSKVSSGELQGIAAATGARLTKQRLQMRLSIAQVPLDEVPVRLKTLVSATASLF